MYPKQMILTFLLLTIFAGAQTRIKDVSLMQGMGETQLLGLGLVSGLGGQGDSSSHPLLQFSLRQLLEDHNIDLPEGEIKSKNLAVVSVSAQRRTFLSQGERFDLSVASVGDAKSLEGGELLLTSLQGPDGESYALGQGPLLLASGGQGSKTRASIPRGGIATRGITGEYIQDGRFSFILLRPDFTTAQNIKNALEQEFPDLEVTVVDPSRITMSIPLEFRDAPVSFISRAESLAVTPDSRGRVVVDPNTGIVVMGQGVRIAPVAVSIRGAKILIGQEDPYSGRMEREQFAFEETSTVEELVSLLHELGLSTDNIIEVLQAIDRAGALYGILEVL